MRKYQFVVIGILMLSIYFCNLLNQINHDKRISETNIVSSGVNSYFTFVSGAPPQAKDKPIAVITQTPIIQTIKSTVLGINEEKFIKTGNLPMDALNVYRTSKGLSAIRTDSYTCDFAKIRAEEASTNFSHEGFEKRKNEGTIPYPGYTHIVENIAKTSKGNPVELWAKSPSHDENMRSDITFGCVGEHNGYYVFEGWKQ